MLSFGRSVAFDSISRRWSAFSGTFASQLFKRMHGISTTVSVSRCAVCDCVYMNLCIWLPGCLVRLVRSLSACLRHVYEVRITNDDRIEIPKAEKIIQTQFIRLYHGQSAYRTAPHTTNATKCVPSSNVKTDICSCFR